MSIEHWKVAGLFGVACVLSAAVPGSADAQKRVVVTEIEGRGGSLIRGGAVRALDGEVDVVSSSELSSAASRLGVDVDGGKPELSGELEIAVWVIGEVERSRRTTSVSFTLINGANGATLGVVSYEAKNPKLLQKRVQRSLWTDVADLIAQAEAPARAEPEPEPIDEPEPEPIQEPTAIEDEEDDTAREPEDEGGEGGPSPLDLGVFFAGFSRSFEYNDDLSGLRTYDLPLGPTVMLKLRWYPGAHFEQGVLANIGLDLRGQFAFGIDSALDDVSFPTSSSGFGAGLRFRVPIDDHELAAVAGYAAQSFKIESARSGGVEMRPGVPSASYAYARLGAEFRFAIGDSFAIGAAAAFLPTFSTGDVESDAWFPNASATGMEGELSAGYALSPALELNAAVGMQRFAFSFNPELEHADAGRAIAGGAVDQYVWGTLGARWTLGR